MIEKIVPSHIEWSFGGKTYTDPVKASSSDFCLRFKPVLESRTYHFREEFYRAIDKLDQARCGRSIALAFNGRHKSDLIAMELRNRGIPFELYFLNLWGLNSSQLNSTRSKALRLGKELRVFEVAAIPFFKHAKRQFLSFGCESPTPLALAYLFEQIPSEYFIVAGEGGVDRSGGLFSHIGAENPLPKNEKGAYLPFSLGNIFYYLWAIKNGRPGEYYFFDSTPELVGSVLSDPLLNWNYPFCDCSKVILNAFPELDLSPVEKNWHSVEAQNQNKEIRSALRRLAIGTDGFQFWHKLIGTSARVSDIFYSSLK